MTSSETNPHRRLYDGIAEWYVRTFYADFSDADWLRLFTQITPPGSVIVDIGSGPGQYARFFRQHGHPTVSMDLAERMLSVGKHLDPELAPVVGDISTIPLKNDSIGGVLAAYTLEHVKRQDTGRALESIARVLIPNGVMGLMVKCGDGYYDFNSSLVPGARGFVQLWNLEDLASELKRVGCETVFTDQKSPVSPEEFNHERGFVLARKRLD